MRKMGSMHCIVVFAFLQKYLLTIQISFSNFPLGATPLLPCTFRRALCAGGTAADPAKPDDDPRTTRVRPALSRFLRMGIP